nr:hypothetical protein [Saccharothrix deserti]
MIRVVRARESLEFSPLEATLPALAPLVHQAHTAQAAAGLAHVDPVNLDPIGGDEDRRSYERYLSGQQERRLVTRAAQRGLADRATASDDIAWWLFHRWIESRQGGPRHWTRSLSRTLRSAGSSSTCSIA